MDQTLHDFQLQFLQCLVKENEWIRRNVCECEELDPSIADNGVRLTLRSLVCCSIVAI